VYLSVGGAVFFDGPTGLVAESLEDLVVVAVLRELVVPVHSQAGVDLRRDRSPPPLPPLVVLPFLPCRHSGPRRHSQLLLFAGKLYLEQRRFTCRIISSENLFAILGKQTGNGRDPGGGFFGQRE
jgi:hypothetical protein